MAPPIITCPRREWGVPSWFISEYIIRFRFYVDGRRPFVRPVWRTNDHGGKMQPRSEIRAWIGAHGTVVDSVRSRSYWWNASAAFRIWSSRYLFESRSSIFFARRRWKRTSYVSSPGLFPLGTPWLGSLVGNLFATEMVVFLSVATSFSINGEWILFFFKLLSGQSNIFTANANVSLEKRNIIILTSYERTL